MSEATLIEDTSLRDRVQSLRLPQRVDGGGSTRGGWLPWALTLLLAASTASLAARVYTSPSPVTDARAIAAGGPTGNAPSPSQTSVSPSADPSKSVSAGTVVLESKGYLIA